MSGQRQPVDLLLAKGNKHLTKEEIELRKSQEIKANNDDIHPPDYLTKPQKKEFKKYAKELVAIGIMTNLDCNCLANFIVAKDLYVDSLENLREIEMLIEIEDRIVLNEAYIDLSKLMNLYYKQARTAAIDMGLTISSRCRLVVPKPKEPEKVNKFAKFKKN